MCAETEHARLSPPKLGEAEAVANMPALLDAARQSNTPVIHTNILYHAPDQLDGGIWVQKSPVMRAMANLKLALGGRIGVAGFDTATAHQIADILDEAARRIERL